MKLPKIIFFIGLGLAFAFVGKSIADAETLDRIVAKVGSDVITQTDLDKRISSLDKKTNSSNRDQILQDLILDKVLASEIEEEKISVSDEAVDSELNLRKRSANQTDADLAKQLTIQGRTLVDLRKDIKFQMQTQQFVQKKIAPLVVINDDDLQREYRDHIGDYQEFSKFRFIQAMLDRSEFESIDQLHQTADAIHSRLVKGQSAKDLIVKYSSGPFHENGGDSGLMSGSDLQEQIRGVLSSLKVGETSPAFETPAGVLIFKLLSKSDPHPVAFEKVRSVVQARVTDRLYRDALKRYLMSVKGRTYVELVK